MKNTKQNSILFLCIATRQHHKDKPYLLQASLIENGEITQVKELRIGHLNTLTERRVKTATTAQILTFITDVIKEYEGADVRIGESLTYYISTL